MKQNKATDPLDVGFLSLVRIVLNADGIADAIEQFLGGGELGAVLVSVLTLFLRIGLGGMADRSG